MKQTKIVSLVEVLVNVFTGFAVAMMVWHFVVPVFFPRMSGPIEENIIITAIFTIFSIARGYGWRRFFARGFHAALVNWIGRSAGGKKL